MLNRQQPSCDRLLDRQPLKAVDESAVSSLLLCCDCLLIFYLEKAAKSLKFAIPVVNTAIDRDESVALRDSSSVRNRYGKLQKICSLFQIKTLLISFVSLSFCVFSAFMMTTATRSFKLRSPWNDSPPRSRKALSLCTHQFLEQRRKAGTIMQH